MHFKNLFIALLALGTADAKIKKLIDTSGKFEPDKITTPQTKNIALGSCPCDLTLNSCDVFCCCDADCSSDILDFWNTNYEEYCAKNYIYEKYKPYSQCIDQNTLYAVNSRMGMQESVVNGRTCVELDVGG
jgi:hypothetical protein